MREILQKECPICRHGASVLVSLRIEVPSQTYLRYPSTHPTALPNRNIHPRRIGKLGEKLAPIPKTAVRNRVELNGSARPSISDKTPQPIAPTIIYASQQQLLYS